MPEKPWGEWIIRYLEFTVWTRVVKRTTSLFNSFFRNVAKQVERFCCPSVLLRAPSKSQNWKIGPLFWQRNEHFRELTFFYCFASDLRRVWSGWSVSIVEFFLRTWNWSGRADYGRPLKNFIPWIPKVSVSKYFLTFPQCIWIIICFWETAHLPLP